MNQKTSLHKDLFSRFSLKAISLFTAGVFLCSSFLSFPAQALGQTPISSNVQGGTDTSLLASASATSGKVQELVIPPDIGTINDVYRIARGAAPIQFNPSEVVLIEDAHSVPDAQRSLEKLIEYLQEVYGVTTVALEGAEGKLDPQLFRNFHDREKLVKVFTEYLDSGELSGAVAASVLSSHKADYVGIEDWKLYQEGVAAFLGGLKKQGELNTQNATFNKELQKLKTKYYSKEAIEFDAKFRAWQADPRKLISFLEFLAKYEVPSIKRLALSALFKTLAQEKTRDSKIEAEVKRLAQDAHKIVPSAELNGFVQDYRTGHLSLAAFAYEVSNLLRKAGKQVPSLSENLQKMVTGHETLVSMKGQTFSAELAGFIESIKAKLLTTPEAKAVDELDGRVQRMEKLIKFELSRSEWETLRAGNGEGGTTNVKLPDTPDIQSLRGKFLATYRLALVTDFFRFYEIAMEREKIFYSRLKDLLGVSASHPSFPVSRDTNTVVFVAGGFHTEGLAAKLKEQGVSYVVVSPRIGEIPNDHRYLDQMQGKVSWQKYFRPKNGKINLYDAFVNATVERLTLQGTGSRYATYDLSRTALKEWRDDIIRTLAAEGRVAEHSKYTRFIDQSLAGHSEEFRALKEKWTAKLEKFIEGLRFLNGKNQLSEANVMKLFQQPANQTPCAAASLRPGAVMDVRGFGQWETTALKQTLDGERGATTLGISSSTRSGGEEVPREVNIPKAVGLPEPAHVAPEIENVRAEVRNADRQKKSSGETVRAEQDFREWFWDDPEMTGQIKSFLAGKQPGSLSITHYQRKSVIRAGNETRVFRHNVTFEGQKPLVFFTKEVRRSVYEKEKKLAVLFGFFSFLMEQEYRLAQKAAAVNHYPEVMFISRKDGDKILVTRQVAGRSLAYFRKKKDLWPGLMRSFGSALANLHKKAGVRHGELTHSYSNDTRWTLRLDHIYAQPLESNLFHVSFIDFESGKEIIPGSSEGLREFRDVRRSVESLFSPEAAQWFEEGYRSVKKGTGKKEAAVTGKQRSEVRVTIQGGNLGARVREEIAGLIGRKAKSNPQYAAVASIEASVVSEKPAMVHRLVFRNAAGRDLKEFLVSGMVNKAPPGDYLDQLSGSFERSALLSRLDLSNESSLFKKIVVTVALLGIMAFASHLIFNPRSHQGKTSVPVAAAPATHFYLLFKDHAHLGGLGETGSKFKAEAARIQAQYGANARILIFNEDVLPPGTIMDLARGKGIPVNDTRDLRKFAAQIEPYYYGLMAELQAMRANGQLQKLTKDMGYDQDISEKRYSLYAGIPNATVLDEIVPFDVWLDFVEATFDPAQLLEVHIDKTQDRIVPDFYGAYREAVRRHWDFQHRRDEAMVKLMSVKVGQLRPQALLMERGYDHAIFETVWKGLGVDITMEDTSAQHPGRIAVIKKILDSRLVSNEDLLKLYVDDDVSQMFYLGLNYKPDSGEKQVLDAIRQGMRNKIWTMTEGDLEKLAIRIASYKSQFNDPRGDLVNSWKASLAAAQTLEALVTRSHGDLREVKPAHVRFLNAYAAYWDQRIQYYPGWFSKLREMDVLTPEQLRQLDPLLQRTAGEAKNQAMAQNTLERALFLIRLGQNQFLHSLMRSETRFNVRMEEKELERRLKDAKQRGIVDLDAEIADLQRANDELRNAASKGKTMGEKSQRVSKPAAVLSSPKMVSKVLEGKETFDEELTRLRKENTALRSKPSIRSQKSGGPRSESRAAENKIIFNGQSDPGVFQSHGFDAVEKVLLNETISGRKFEEYWAGREKNFIALMDDEGSANLLGVLVGEVVRNASERQPGGSDAKVEARVMQIPEGPTLLRVVVRQGRVTEEQWTRLARNSELSLLLLQDFYWRSALHLKENYGKGLESFSKLALMNVPVRLEFERREQGMVATLFAEVDRMPGETAEQGMSPRRVFGDRFMARLKTRLATGVWKEGWDILERNKKDWGSFYTAYNLEKCIDFLADAVEQFNTVALRAAYERMAVEGYAVPRCVADIRAWVAGFEQLSSLLLKVLKSDGNRSGQGLSPESNDLKILGRWLPSMIPSMRANTGMIRRLEALVERTKASHQLVLSALDDLPKTPSFDDEESTPLLEEREEVAGQLQRSELRFEMQDAELHRARTDLVRILAAPFSQLTNLLAEGKIKTQLRHVLTIKRKTLADWLKLIDLSRAFLGSGPNALLTVRQVIGVVRLVDPGFGEEALPVALRHFKMPLKRAGLLPGAGAQRRENNFEIVSGAAEILKEAGEEINIKSLAELTGMGQSSIKKLGRKVLEGLGTVFYDLQTLSEKLREQRTDLLRDALQKNPGATAAQLSGVLGLTIAQVGRVGGEQLAELGATVMTGFGDRRRQDLQKAVYWLIRNRPLERPSYEALPSAFEQLGLKRVAWTALAQWVKNNREPVLFDHTVEMMERFEYFKKLGVLDSASLDHFLDDGTEEEPKEIEETRKPTLFFEEWKLLHDTVRRMVDRTGMPGEWAGELIMHQLGEGEHRKISLYPAEAVFTDLRDIGIEAVVLSPELKESIHQLLRTGRAFNLGGFLNAVEDSLARMASENVPPGFEKQVVIKAFEIFSEFWMERHHAEEFVGAFRHYFREARPSRPWSEALSQSGSADAMPDSLRPELLAGEVEPGIRSEVRLKQQKTEREHAKNVVQTAAKNIALFRNHLQVLRGESQASSPYSGGLYAPAIVLDGMWNGKHRVAISGPHWSLKNIEAIDRYAEAILNQSEKWLIFVEPLHSDGTPSYPETDAALKLAELGDIPFMDPVPSQFDPAVSKEMANQYGISLSEINRAYIYRNIFDQIRLNPYMTEDELYRLVTIAIDLQAEESKSDRKQMIRDVTSNARTVYQGGESARDWTRKAYDIQLKMNKVINDIGRLRLNRQLKNYPERTNILFLSGRFHGAIVGNEAAEEYTLKNGLQFRESQAEAYQNVAGLVLAWAKAQPRRSEVRDLKGLIKKTAEFGFKAAKIMGWGVLGIDVILLAMNPLLVGSVIGQYLLIGVEGTLITMLLYQLRNVKAPWKAVGVAAVGIAALALFFHVFLPHFVTILAFSSLGNLGDVVLKIGMRAAGIFSGIFFYVLIEGKVLKHTEAAKKTPLSTGLRWAMGDGLVLGFFFYAIFYPFLGATIPVALHFPFLLHFFSPSLAASFSTAILKLAFDLTIVTALVHGPMQVVTKVVLGEMEKDALTRPYRHSKAVKSYLDMYPIIALVMTVIMGLAWMKDPAGGMAVSGTHALFAMLNAMLSRWIVTKDISGVENGKRGADASVKNDWVEGERLVTQFVTLFHESGIQPVLNDLKNTPILADPGARLYAAFVVARDTFDREGVVKREYLDQIARDLSMIHWTVERFAEPDKTFKSGITLRGLSEAVIKNPEKFKDFPDRITMARNVMEKFLGESVDPSVKAAIQKKFSDFREPFIKIESGLLPILQRLNVRSEARGWKPVWWEDFLKDAETVFEFQNQAGYYEDNMWHPLSPDDLLELTSHGRVLLVVPSSKFDESSLEAVRIANMIRKRNPDLQILVAGKYGELPSQHRVGWFWDEFGKRMTEAKYHALHMSMRGVEPDYVVEKYTHTGEIAQGTRSLMDEKKIRPENLLIVDVDPLRVTAVFRKQLLTPEEFAQGKSLKDLGIRRIIQWPAKGKPIRELATEEAVRVAAYLVTELIKLWDYVPPRGDFITPVPVNQDVVEAAARLNARLREVPELVTVVPSKDEIAGREGRFKDWLTELTASFSRHEVIIVPDQGGKKTGEPRSEARLAVGPAGKIHEREFVFTRESASDFHASSAEQGKFLQKVSNDLLNDGKGQRLSLNWTHEFPQGIPESLVRLRENVVRQWGRVDGRFEPPVVDEQKQYMRKEVETRDFQFVLTELVKNAAKSLKGPNKYGKIQLKISKREGSLWIELSDEGVGIKTVEDRGTWISVVSDKNVQSGYGIALPWIKLLLEARGGRLEILSPSPYSGYSTTMRLVIPENEIQIKSAADVRAEMRQQAVSNAVTSFKTNYQGKLATITEYPDPQGLSRILKGLEVRDGKYQGRVLDPGFYIMVHPISANERIIQEAKKEFSDFLTGLRGIFGKDGGKVGFWIPEDSAYHLALHVFQNSNEFSDEKVSPLDSDQRSKVRGIVREEAQREAAPFKVLQAGYGITADGGFVTFLWDESGRLSNFQKNVSEKTVVALGQRVTGWEKRGHVTVGRIMSLPYSDDPAVRAEQKKKVFEYIRQKADDFSGKWEANLTDPSKQVPYSIPSVTVLQENQWCTLRGSEQTTIPVFQKRNEGERIRVAISKGRRIVLPESFGFKEGDDLILLGAMYREPVEIIIARSADFMNVFLPNLRNVVPDPETRAAYKRLYGAQSMTAKVEMRKSGAQDQLTLRLDADFLKMMDEPRELILKKAKNFSSQIRSEFRSNSQPSESETQMDQIRALAKDLDAGDRILAPRVKDSLFSEMLQQQWTPGEFQTYIDQKNADFIEYLRQGLETFGMHEISPEILSTLRPFYLRAYLVLKQNWLSGREPSRQTILTAYSRLRKHGWNDQQIYEFLEKELLDKQSNITAFNSADRLRTADVIAGALEKYFKTQGIEGPPRSEVRSAMSFGSRSMPVPAGITSGYLLTVPDEFAFNAFVERLSPDVTIQIDTPMARLLQVGNDFVLTFEANVNNDVRTVIWNLGSATASEAVKEHLESFGFQKARQSDFFEITSLASVIVREGQATITFPPSLAVSASHRVKNQDLGSKAFLETNTPGFRSDLRLEKLKKIPLSRERKLEIVISVAMVLMNVSILFLMGRLFLGLNGKLTDVPIMNNIPLAVFVGLPALFLGVMSISSILLQQIHGKRIYTVHVVSRPEKKVPTTAENSENFRSELRGEKHAKIPLGRERKLGIAMRASMTLMSASTLLLTGRLVLESNGKLSDIPVVRDIPLAVFVCLPALFFGVGFVTLIQRITGRRNGAILSKPLVLRVDQMSSKVFMDRRKEPRTEEPWWRVVGRVLHLWKPLALKSAADLQAFRLKPEVDLPVWQSQLAGFKKEFRTDYDQIMALNEKIPLLTGNSILKREFRIEEWIKNSFQNSEAAWGELRKIVRRAVRDVELQGHSIDAKHLPFIRESLAQGIYTHSGLREASKLFYPFVYVHYLATWNHALNEYEASVLEHNAPAQFPSGRAEVRDGLKPAPDLPSSLIEDFSKKAQNVRDVRVAVTLLDELSGLLQGQSPSQLEALKMGIRTETFQSLLTSLRSLFDLSEAEIQKLRLTEPEFLFKYKLFQNLLGGRTPVLASDVKETLALFTPKSDTIYPDVAQALQEALALGKFYLVTGDRSTTLFEKFLLPTGFVFRDASQHIRPQTEAAKNIVSLSNTGINSFVYDPQEDIFKRNQLIAGIKPGDLQILRQVLKSTAERQGLRSIFSEGLGYHHEVDSYPGLVEIRPVSEENDDVSIAFYVPGLLTQESRRTFQSDRLNVKFLKQIAQDINKQIRGRLSDPNIQAEVGGKTAVNITTTNKGRALAEIQTRFLKPNEYFVFLGDQIDDIGNDGPAMNVAEIGVQVGPKKDLRFHPKGLVIFSDVPAEAGGAAKYIRITNRILRLAGILSESQTVQLKEEGRATPRSELRAKEQEPVRKEVTLQPESPQIVFENIRITASTPKKISEKTPGPSVTGARILEMQVMLDAVPRHVHLISGQGDQFAAFVEQERKKDPLAVKAEPMALGQIFSGESAISIVTVREGDQIVIGGYFEKNRNRVIEIKKIDKSSAVVTAISPSTPKLSFQERLREDYSFLRDQGYLSFVLQSSEVLIDSQKDLIRQVVDTNPKSISEAAREKGTSGAKAAWFRFRRALHKMEQYYEIYRAQPLGPEHPVLYLRLNAAAMRVMTRLQIETIGELLAISPRKLQAAGEATSTILQHINERLARNGLPSLSDKERQLTDNDRIELLELDERVRNVLIQHEITTIGQLRQLSEVELESIRNIGSEGRANIIQRLAAYGFKHSFGPSSETPEAVSDLRTEKIVLTTVPARHGDQDGIETLLSARRYPEIVERLIHLQERGDEELLLTALDVLILASADPSRVPCCVNHSVLNTIIEACRRQPFLEAPVVQRVAFYLVREGTGDMVKSVIAELVQKMIGIDMIATDRRTPSFMAQLSKLVPQPDLILGLTDFFVIFKELRGHDHFWHESLDGRDKVLSEEKHLSLKAYSSNWYFLFEKERPVGVVYAAASRTDRKAYISIHIFDKSDTHKGFSSAVMHWISGEISSERSGGEEGFVTVFYPAKSEDVSFMLQCAQKGIFDRVEGAHTPASDAAAIFEHSTQWATIRSSDPLALSSDTSHALFVRGVVSAPKTPITIRSESRVVEAKTDLYAGIARAVVEGKPIGQNELTNLIAAVRVNIEDVIRDLRASLAEQILPQAMAEMITGETGQAVAFQELERVLREKNLSREKMERLAEKLFQTDLNSLAESIRTREVGGMAPVIFYSPEMKDRLTKFILTVQQGFEAVGDATGKQYRITLVSENKAELLKFETELSKSGTGMLRGVHFIGGKDPEDIAAELSRSVFENEQFRGKFGIFFPEEAMAQKISEWQRVVRSEIPKEYGILLLPALSRYFAKTATSDINATTLRHALPDLFASAAFRIGQGIAIVAAFLQHIAAAEREISASA